RAATYYAMATYSTAGSRRPGAFDELWTEHRGCWDRAVALFEPPARRVAIPYEHTTLEGYLFRVDESGARRPLVILNNGSDGPVSAMWAQGAAGVARGYNCLTFDGPGQNAALVRQHLFFRPDWEAVLSPVVDYALSLDEVDPDRLAVVGVSQGGFWVPRAVAFEHRIAAAVADPGVWDVGTVWRDRLPGGMRRHLDRGDRASFERDMAMAQHVSRQRHGELSFRMRPFGIPSLYDLYQALRAYTLDDVVAGIRCPMLVCDPDNEQFWPGQSRRLYDALPGPKALAAFPASEGSDGHCEPRSPAIRNQRVFDWLDETLTCG
ncbi:MAG TPA: hypothetical protein VE152_12100, partial [Acidimicrobiales bacterium]|nr:hypothetical protein [Acidimicrobiales bacterium]